MELNKLYYSASTVMRNIPEIMGMSLEQKPHRNGHQWVGPYRLTGERCGHRRDKLKIFADRGTVWVHEEGETPISVQHWLVDYGGCPDYREAGRVLRCADPAKRAQECVIATKARCQVGKYVTNEQWREFANTGLDHCQLYAWMCRMFGMESADEAFGLYNVTSNERGEAVYWYVDVDGNICHDKVMAYKWDGHRDKSRGGWRKYTTSDGYTNRCYFGSQLLGAVGESGDKRVMVVEGEKTAMMCSIVWPEYIWIATGGKNQLRDIEQGWTLLPDVDAADEWSGRGSVSRWWEAWKGAEEHSDIGDMVEACVKLDWLEPLRTKEEKDKLFNNF